MRWPEVLTDALPSSGAFPQVEALSLAADPRSVGLARGFVAERTTSLDDAAAMDLKLVTSELVTNAVVHARTAFEVAVVLTEEAVVVMVHDLDLGRREVPTHERDGGRGLSIVAELSCASGQVKHAGGGKTCWARLCRGSGSQASS